MLKDFNVSVSVVASSVSRNVSGTYDLNARFGGTIPADGNWSTSKSVNQEIYEANKADVKEDYERFDEKVEGLADKISPIINATMEQLLRELEQELAKQQE